MQEDYKDLLKAYLPEVLLESKKIMIPQEFENLEECINYSCTLQYGASELIISDEKNVFLAEKLLQEAMKLNNVIMKACVIMDKLNKQWT